MFDFLLYWTWRTGSSLAQRVPLWLAYAVGGLLGDLAYLLWRSKRDIAKHNLAEVMGRDPGELPVARTARQSFREYAKYVIEIMRMPRLSDEQLDAPVEGRGDDHLAPTPPRGGAG